MNKIKTGLIGVGHLGSIHARLLHGLDELDFHGCYDSNPEHSAKAAKDYGVMAYQSADELIRDSEAVIIVTPTSTHFDYAAAAVRTGKHIFVEKPVTSGQKSAHQLLKLAEEAGVKAQVGHVERFNPVFLKVKELDPSPRFIESHRLAEFNPRGTDVSVIMDLMIHDIDLIISLIKSPVQSVSANGVAVLSNKPDIANARITFDNGSVVNLTASRISLKKMRKMRLFEKNHYITLDFLKKELNIFSLKDAPEESANKPNVIPVENGRFKEISFENPDLPEVNAIEMELASFARSIRNDEPVEVSIEEAYTALKVAEQIQEKLNDYRKV